MKMNNVKNSILLLGILLFTASCSVISSQIRDEAMAPMPFNKLAANSNQYIGKTVILGGFILKTENKADETLISVLQTPLSSMEYPYNKDQSEGRFVVINKGFLDPEVYRPNRRITVAGTIVGTKTEQIGSCPYACLTLESKQIYLWPRHMRRNYWRGDPYYWNQDPFWYGGPYYDPYYGGYYRPYYGSPYWGPGYAPYPYWGDGDEDHDSR